MSFCATAIVAANKRRERADKGDELQRRTVRDGRHQRISADDQVDAGRHHGGGVDQRRDRGRAFHGIGQPDMQWELSALADGAHEDQDGDQRGPGRRADQRQIDGGGGQRAPASPGLKMSAKLREPVWIHSRRMPASMNMSPTRVVRKALSPASFGRDLLGVRVLAGKPEADQQVGAQAHEFPEDQQHEQVIGQDQAQHAGGEQGDVGKEAAGQRVHMTRRRGLAALVVRRSAGLPTPM